MRRGSPSRARAVARLEAAERAPKWFADPDVRPGQWVHFEAPMSYGVVVGAATSLDVDESVDGYPSGGQLRLLLHGSSAHLLGAGHPEHRTGRQVTFSLWLHFTHALCEATVENGRSDLDDNQLFAGWLRRVLQWLDREFQPRFTAAWVAGYARANPHGHGAGRDAALRGARRAAGVIRRSRRPAAAPVVAGGRRPAPPGRRRARRAATRAGRRGPAVRPGVPRSRGPRRGWSGRRP